MILTLQARNTITITRELRQALSLEPGDPLEARVEDHRLILTPVAVVPRTYCLSLSGKVKEAEADEDVRQGRVREFATAEALLEDLAE